MTDEINTNTRVIINMCSKCGALVWDYTQDEPHMKAHMKGCFPKKADSEQADNYWVLKYYHKAWLKELARGRIADMLYNCVSLPYSDCEKAADKIIEELKAAGLEE